MSTDSKKMLEERKSSTEDGVSSSKTDEENVNVSAVSVRSNSSRRAATADSGSVAGNQHKKESAKSWRNDESGKEIVDFGKTDQSKPVVETKLSAEANRESHKQTASSSDDSDKETEQVTKAYVSQLATQKSVSADSRYGSTPSVRSEVSKESVKVRTEKAAIPAVHARDGINASKTSLRSQKSPTLHRKSKDPVDKSEAGSRTASVVSLRSAKPNDDVSASRTSVRSLKSRNVHTQLVSQTDKSEVENRTASVASLKNDRLHEGTERSAADGNITGSRTSVKSEKSPAIDKAVKSSETKSEAGSRASRGVITKQDSDEADADSGTLGSKVSVRSLNSAESTSSSSVIVSKPLKPTALQDSQRANDRSSAAEEKSVNGSGTDSDSDGDIVIGSMVRRPAVVSRSGPSTSAGGRGRETREWSRPGLVARQMTLLKPKTLRDWKVARSKGGFFFDDNSKVISHKYSLRLTSDTNVWITIEPLCIKPGGDLNSMCEVKGSPVDMMVFVLNADDDLVAFCEQRDSKGKYALSCELARGSYKLAAFTSGCRFQRRTSDPRQVTELLRKKDDKLVLTKAFKDVVNDIFDMCDLSGNGLWSRDEFRLYNLLTSEQELDDAEWQVVEEKVEMSDGNITRQGFLQLNQMEADDNDEDLWITLSAMGYNNALVMDEASPFLVEVYAEKCNPSLKVLNIDFTGKVLMNAVIDMVIRKGEESRVKGGKDLFMYAYATDYQLALVIENRSHSKQSVTVDCRKSQNITSHQPTGLLCTVDVPSKSAVNDKTVTEDKTPEDLTSLLLIC